MLRQLANLVCVELAFAWAVHDLCERAAVRASGPILNFDLRYLAGNASGRPGLSDFSNRQIIGLER